MSSSGDLLGDVAVVNRRLEKVARFEICNLFSRKELSELSLQP